MEQRPPEHNGYLLGAWRNRNFARKGGAVSKSLKLTAADLLQGNRGIQTKGIATYKLQFTVRIPYRIHMGQMNQVCTGINLNCRLAIDGNNPVCLSITSSIPFQGLILAALWKCRFPAGSRAVTFRQGAGIRLRRTCQSECGNPFRKRLCARFCRGILVFGLLRIIFFRVVRLHRRQRWSGTVRQIGALRRSEAACLGGWFRRLGWRLCGRLGWRFRRLG